MLKRSLPCILAAALVLGLIGANLLTWTGSYPDVPDSGPDPHHPDRYLTVWGAWDAEKLTEVTADPEPVGYGLRLLRQDGPEIEAEIYNDGIEKVTFSKRDSLQVQLDGAWYRVPRMLNFDETLTRQFLDRGQTRPVTMSKDWLDTVYNWSKLPAGQYRLRWLGQEFALER